VTAGSCKHRHPSRSGWHLAFAGIHKTICRCRKSLRCAAPANPDSSSFCGYSLSAEKKNIQCAPFWFRTEISARAVHDFDGCSRLSLEGFGNFWHRGLQGPPPRNSNCFFLRETNRRQNSSPQASPATIGPNIFLSAILLITRAAVVILSES